MPMDDGVTVEDVDILIHELRQTMSCIAGTIQVLKRKRYMITKGIQI